MMYSEITISAEKRGLGAKTSSSMTEGSSTDYIKKKKIQAAALKSSQGYFHHGEASRAIVRTIRDMVSEY